MENKRQTIAMRVKEAFERMNVVRPHLDPEKFGKYYDAIANFLLGYPGVDEYKFIRALVVIMRRRHCKFVHPKICANRERMKEALAEVGKPDPLGVEIMLEACRQKVNVCIANGVCKTAANALVSPVTGLPAWFRLVESKFDPEVVEYYMESAKEELAKDQNLSDYLHQRFPEKW